MGQYIHITPTALGFQDRHAAPDVTLLNMQNFSSKSTCRHCKANCSEFINPVPALPCKIVPFRIRQRGKEGQHLFKDKINIVTTLYPLFVNHP
jgi:hypothetical protein